jgi:hypothetical protein
MESLTLEENIQGDQCTICFDIINDVNKYTTNCNHSYCKTCLDTWFDRGEKSCPVCRGDIQYLTYNSENIRVIYNNLNQQNQLNQLNNNLIRTNRTNYILKKYLYISIFIIFFQSYFIINNYNLFSIDIKYYENQIYNCLENNTDISNDLLACKDKNNDLYQLNVIDYVTNIAKSCFFPYYYVNKCYSS